LKTAIITGISGQDASYLADLLVKKNYTSIIGTCRNVETVDLIRLKYLGIKGSINIVQADLTNYSEVESLISQYEPEEVYHLAAQSSVGQSFKSPSETFHFNTISVLNFLQAILKVDKSIRFYQASSSEMFGNVDVKSLPIKESLLFHPVSPYGISKASAHWLTVNYREAFGLYTACGILFNHESALRASGFVIKKLINTAIQIQRGETDFLTLGNLAISRDWGYAPKYVEAMWKMLQQEEGNDYVICSGNISSLQELVLMVFDKLNLSMKDHLKLDQAFMRSLDLRLIYGDNSKAKKKLNWNYNYSTEDLIDLLIQDEIAWIDWNHKQKASS